MTWRMMALEECTRIVGGATPSTTVTEFWDGNIWWATPKDLSDLETLYLTGTARKITKLGLAGCAAEVLPPGSVLFSSRAPIGHVAINRVPVATNQGFKSFIPNKGILEAGYLAWWLKANRARLESLGNGATFKELSKSAVARIEIPVPPLPEQRRIAAILDQADELRRKRRQALALIAGLPQAIMRVMFGDLLTNPHNYPFIGLGQLCDVRDGTHATPAYVDIGYPLVTSKNLSGGQVDLSEARFISESDYIEINRRSKVDRGDILMPMIGTIGSPVLIEDDPLYAIKNVALIKFKPESPANGYVLEVLRSDYFEAFIKARNRGGTQKFLSLGDIRSIPVPVPPVKNQTAFCLASASVACIRSAQERSLAELDALFASLQHRAFAGDLTCNKISGDKVLSHAR